ncbi:efflux transporter SaoE [Maridesulfovibrio frigidus]|uniref:efflux transporter SaoE n=1 Tax=Maridesulfovibrio frigidus TaxID=340956 RepID=UPI0004E0B8D1|nr:efflux transporter SaoE [Maridesulfovibrio frigidus]
MFQMFTKPLLLALDILNDASPWLLASFILAGVLHEYLRPEILQKMMGNDRLSSIIKATLSGMLLPICSCGVIPLGLGLYYSGAYLGPTLAFMTSTPIINPAAAVLAFGLLGPKIAGIYILAGFTVPLVMGLIGNRFGGLERQLPGMENLSAPPVLENMSAPSVKEKLLAGLRWGFWDLGVMVSRYIVFGVLLAGMIIALTPHGAIQEYLGNPGMISLFGIAALGAIMYVCAVGHIPFIAALVAGGAAPGVAIVFLMTGAATNLPELLSMYKMIGKRCVIIYSSVLIITALAFGRLANYLLMPDFIPVFSLGADNKAIDIANSLIVSVPDPIQYFCSLIIVLLGAHSVVPSLMKIFSSKRVTV